MNNYKIYRGKLILSKDTFKKIFCYETENFITKGSGYKKALGSFIDIICNHLKETASVVCKDRFSGEHLSIVLHHNESGCGTRYKVTTLKAGVLAEENVELYICENEINCTW
jgi:hypothetical protein